MLLVLFVTLGGCSNPKSETREKSKIKQMNVLFIAVDDLNDYVQSLGGHPDAITPNIDKLVQHSYVFENAYCPAPLCNPSRAALLSGIAPYNSGVYDNRQPMRLAMEGSELVTLPQYFKDNGYYVAGAGKMYHNKFPDAASWTDYYPELGVQSTFGKEGEPIQNIPQIGYQKIGHHEWGGLIEDDSVMVDYKSVQYIENKLKDSLNEPFFLACGFNKPHTPYFVPQKYFDLYKEIDVQLPKTMDDDLKDIPGIGKSWTSIELHEEVVQRGKWKELVTAYLATTSFVDAMVGKALNALKNSQYADNTLIVFWSDHGYHLGEKMHWDKYTLWEEATKNPMLISIPGQKERINVFTSVNLIDLYPTLIELCKLPVQTGLDGHSLGRINERSKYTMGISCNYGLWKG